MEAHAIYPGSCGELVQGRINGKDMLMSCPVSLYTKVRVFESQTPKSRFKYRKSSTLLDNMLKRWGYGNLYSQFDIAIQSSIPQCKGFASSTADLCGVYICLLKLFNKKYDIQEAVEEFIRIEPTDSIVFRNMVLFDYKQGRYYENAGEYLKFYILAFEGNRIVDTIEYNKKDLSPLSDLDDIFKSLKDGIKSADISMIAKASETSIKRNLNRLFYDNMSEVEKLCHRTRGLGLLGGHSGDVLGIIYDDKERFLHAAEYKNSAAGCKAYMLETLRGNEYEREYDYR